MDKLIEKHKEALNGHVIMTNKVCGINSASNTHANITKEVACGFAEWKDFNCNKCTDSYNEYWCNIDNYSQRRNNTELFDLYIKSL